MLGANVMWGLMSPLAKLVMVGGAVTPLVVTDLRIFGAMVLFWITSFFRKPEHVGHKDMAKLLVASLLAIVFNQGCFIFGVGLTSPGDASIITTSMPLWAMALAAIFLKEPITGKKVLGIAAGAGGALLLIMGSHQAQAQTPGRSISPSSPIELRFLHRIVQEFCGKILTGNHHEMDVHLRVYLHAPLLFWRLNGNRLAGFRSSGNRSANIRRSRRHLL